MGPHQKDAEKLGSLSTDLNVGEAAKHKAAESPKPKEKDAESGGTKAKSKVTRRKVTTLVIMMYCNLWLAACYSLLAPFFHEEAAKKGVSDTVYGLMFGIYQLVIFFVSPICGALIPITTPKFMMNAGVFVTGSCSVLFGLLDGCKTTQSFTALVFLVRTLEAAGAAAYVTSSFTFVASEFPDKRATVLSCMETVYGVGMIVGPAVGGALYEFRGYFLPFVTMGCVLFFGAVLTFFFLPPIDAKVEEKKGSALDMICHPSFLIDVATFFVTFLIIGFNEATLQPLLSSASLSLGYAAQGSVFIVMGGLYAFATPLWGFLADRIANPQLLSLLGCVLCIFGIMFLGPVFFLPIKTSLWLIIVSQAFLGFGLGAKLVSGFVHAMKYTISRGYPADVSTYSMISGIVMSVSSIGAFIGPFIGGLVLDHFTYNKGSVIILGLEVLLGIILLCYTIFEYSTFKLSNSNEEKSKLILKSMSNK